MNLLIEIDEIEWRKTLENSTAGDHEFALLFPDGHVLSMLIQQAGKVNIKVVKYRIVMTVKFSHDPSLIALRTFSSAAIITPSFFLSFFFLLSFFFIFGWIAVA